MSLSVIFGKPGAGKSYYAVYRISEYLEDFCRSEISNGFEHDRKIYTNLPLNLDEIDSFISDRLGSSVRASKYVVLLNDDFFVERASTGQIKKIDWWEKIPDGALIVIDEVQHYLSSSKDEGGAYLKDFQLYISTHRHRQHDLIFLTQHTDNINKVCLNMAADAYHVINIKGRVIPFLGIPFADIDVVKEAFGYKQQYANILYGNYIGRAFKAESTLHILLKPEIYKLYRSHNTDEATDRPSLNMTRIGAVLWFIRRHFWHLFLKGVLVCLIFHLTWQVICKLPLHLSNTLQKQMQSEGSLTLPKVSKLQESSPTPARSASVDNVSPARTAETPNKLEPPKIEIITPDYFVVNGIRYKEGDVFNYDDKKYLVKIIDFDRRFVDLGLCSSCAADGGTQPACGDGSAGQDL